MGIRTSLVIALVFGTGAAGAVLAASPCTVGIDNYSKLQTGMTYSTVASFLGCHGEEVSSSSRTIVYTWRGAATGANMNAVFQDDQLVSKAQSGLR